MCLHIALLLVLLGQPFAVYSQSDAPEEITLEQILERISQKTNQSDLLDQIDELRNRPVELSSSSITDISKIPTISLLTAAKISELARAGKSLDAIITELNLSEESAWLLKYCSFINLRIKLKEQKNYLKSRTRAVEQMNMLRGFWSDKFTGGRTDLYQRFQAGRGNYSGGILMSKDMGEQFRYGFLSGYLNADYDIIKITAGDFYIQSGMGNILWNTNAMGKGSDVISPANQFANAVVNYKSSTEYGFFRGAALSSDIALSPATALNGILWVSSTPRSATIDTSQNIATSIYETGYFRTESEISKMNKLTEFTAGANLNIKTGPLIAGVTSFALAYDKELKSESTSALRGKTGLFSTAFAMLTLEESGYGFETSRDAHGFMAYKLTALFRKKDYELTFHGRAFTKNFCSPFGSIFGESSAPTNEYGLYSGFTYTGFSNLRLSSYLDLYSTFGPTYYVPQPVRGIDFLNDAQVKLSTNNELRIRLQYETKTDAITIDAKTKEKEIFFRTKYTVRLEYIHDIADIVRLKGRFDANLVNFESVEPFETGIAGYFELMMKIFENLKLTGRFAYFSTKSFNSAIWQYEMILPGYFSSPPLYGNGFRSFVSVGYEPFGFMTLSLHYSFMKKYNENTLSSGYTEIMGNTDNRIYLQLDLDF